MSETSPLLHDDAEFAESSYGSTTGSSFSSYQVLLRGAKEEEELSPLRPERTFIESASYYETSYLDNIGSVGTSVPQACRTSRKMLNQFVL